MTARSIWFVPKQPESPEAIWFDEWDNRLDMPRLPKDIWYAAQAALLGSGQYIKVPPIEEWPYWAKSLKAVFHSTNVGHSDLDYIVIPRPTPAWEPKENEWIWVTEFDRLAAVPYTESYSPDWCAAVENFDQEKTWTKDQFRQRGRFLEVK